MGTLKYLLLVANFLTASVYAAPPMFVVHPLLISNDVKAGTLQGSAQFMIAPAGEGHLLLVAPASSSNPQGEKQEQVEQYDEGVEESRDWKEEDETENEAEIKKEQERKEYYDNGEYTEGKKYEETEDYNEKSYEESSTHALEDSNYYTEKAEDETEKPEEDETNSDDGSWHDVKEGEEEHSTQDYDEKEESANESEYREEKSTNGENNSGDGHPKENVESKRQTSLATSDQKNVKNVKNDANTSDAVKPEQVKSIHIPEEIVIGSKGHEQIGVSNEHDPNTEVSEDKSDTKDSSAFVKLIPPLKETEEVQIAPVVYHVSPKLFKIAPMQVEGV